MDPGLRPARGWGLASGGRFGCGRCTGYLPCGRAGTLPAVLNGELEASAAWSWGSSPFPRRGCPSRATRGCSPTRVDRGGFCSNGPEGRRLRPHSSCRNVPSRCAASLDEEGAVSSRTQSSHSPFHPVHKIQVGPSHRYQRLANDRLPLVLRSWLCSSCVRVRAGTAVTRPRRRMPLSSPRTTDFVVTPTYFRTTDGTVIRPPHVRLVPPPADSRDSPTRRIFR